MRLPLLLITLCLASWAGPASAQSEVGDRLAAAVNGQAITLSDIRWLLNYRGIPVPEADEARQRLYLQVLDQVIDQKLIAAEALQTPGIRVTAQDIEERLEAYKAQFAGEAEFEQRLAEMEMSSSDLQDLIHRQLSVLAFVKIRFEPFIIVLPDQIERYFREELLPQLQISGAPTPQLFEFEEQIRQILTVERTNQEIDRWVSNARSNADVRVLLFREPGLSPNLPESLQTRPPLQPVPPPKPPRS